MLNRILSIVFIVLIGVCYSQKPMIQLMVDPKVAQVGEEITVKVISNLGGNISIDLPSAFVQGGALMQGSETEYDANTGKLTSFFYKSNIGRMKKEGVYTFGPAYIKKDRKVFKSNTVTVKIESDEPVSTSPGDFSVKQLKKPAFGVIEKSKTKIYEGEPLILTAKVYARYRPTHFEGYEPFELEGAIEKHEINVGKDPEIKNIRGMEYFCFEANKQLLFPSGTGKFQISPFKMDLKKGFEGFEFTSSSSSIEVLPLPSNAPRNFTGGVGKFSLEKKITKKNFKQGDFIELTLIVSGQGNIHMISAPQFKLPKELLLYGDPIIEEDINYGVNGSEGSIKYKYNIQIKEGGEIVFPQIAFSYFDINKKEYVQLKEVGEKIQVASNGKSVIAKIPNTTRVEKPNDELKSSYPKMSVSKNGDKGLSKTFYLFVIATPIAFSLLFLLLKKRKISDDSKKKSEHIKKENKKAVQNEIESAEKALQTNQRDIFYASIQQSIFLTCLGETVNDPKTIFNKADLLIALDNRNVDTNIVDEVKTIFRICEESRYGLNLDELSNEQLYELTKKTISELMRLFEKDK
jgi:hypothetical protein